MIRSSLPTDLIAILFQDSSLCNRAKTKDNAGREEGRFSTLATFLWQWLNPWGRRCTWVWIKGFSLRGLASARNRSSSQAWEIDRLLLNEQDGDCCSSLLERLSLAGGELGVEKIFLRFPAESPLLDAAKEAGFSPYTSERLYWWESEEGRLASHGAPSQSFPRRKQVGDGYRLFELYEKCVPVAIRRVEGMTFKQWQANKDRSVGKEWLFEKDSSPVGWLRVRASPDIGQFEVMATPQGELEPMVEFGLMRLKGCRYLLCLVPEFEGELSRLLEDRGFSQVASYSVIVKELVARAHEPCLMPLQA